MKVGIFMSSDYENAIRILGNYIRFRTIIDNYELTISDDIYLDFNFGAIDSNATVLEERKAKIQSYYFFINAIETAIERLDNINQRAIMQLLYIKGMRYMRACRYMDEGNDGLYPIAPTTFADNRRAAIRKIACTFSQMGILDYTINRPRVVKEYSGSNPYAGMNQQ
jgi:hypothetical protein